MIHTYQHGDDEQIAALLLDARAAGDLPGDTHSDLRGVVERLPGDPHGTLLFLEHGQVLGVYQPHHPLLVVRGAFRRRGIGTALVAAGAEWSRERGEREQLLAPPRGSAAAIAFLERLGFYYRSSYWEMELPAAVPVPPPSFPTDILPLPLGENVTDCYVALVNAAFADHAAPLAVTLEQVRHAHTLPGRGPEGTLVLALRREPDRLIGFCRTVTPPGEQGIVPTIALLGLRPEWRGQGLGLQLLRWGVQQLRGVATGPIHLGVEAENERALVLYERSGFVRTSEWPRWARAL
ncbi:MAG: hypothetical protein DCC58_14085 [Chloroflexi bacterium]|nr:MAG: hypothetical protein DCC58_14085 [Chloroflexota bacterium]